MYRSSTSLKPATRPTNRWCCVLILRTWLRRRHGRGWGAARARRLGCRGPQRPGAVGATAAAPTRRSQAHLLRAALRAGVTPAGRQTLVAKSRAARTASAQPGGRIAARLRRPTAAEQPWPRPRPRRPPSPSNTGRNTCLKAARCTTIPGPRARRHATQTHPLQIDGVCVARERVERGVGERLQRRHLLRQVPAHLRAARA
jgi:hypothetical protein